MNRPLGEAKSRLRRERLRDLATRVRLPPGWRRVDMCFVKFPRLRKWHLYRAVKLGAIENSQKEDCRSTHSQARPIAALCLDKTLVLQSREGNAGGWRVAAEGVAQAVRGFRERGYRLALLSKQSRLGRARLVDESEEAIRLVSAQLSALSNAMGMGKEAQIYFSAAASSVDEPDDPPYLGLWEVMVGLNGAMGGVDLGRSVIVADLPEAETVGGAKWEELHRRASVPLLVDSSHLWEPSALFERLDTLQIEGKTSGTQVGIDSRYGFG
uniref:Uncharacterized protein n=1 Tax=Chromera velia CCMP2878 TaxID=1169474 RepID=A0A0G4FI81_9ALVE|eukprot:Cvel_3359.t1-p1 / transcript=Cvel_3359.t1 / gene=Cvel_3359 / organism=Chromera_velia_CCMP2878 / gene_product=hypothetical protein / transcript_product=hypothetical protein / location=Cvel_scaffold134:38368-40517(+) / protein_length=268 / sequence_SO=supercontig / SO=protein_coding / is_pseudo=false